MSLILNKIDYIYGANTIHERKALSDVSVEIKDGDFIGIIGKTGSGKSTLVQMMNALLKPTTGEVYYNGEDIWDKDFDRTKFRGEVGMVFQYPEYQLFESTVIKDVCFGPRNIGMKPLEIELNSYDALKMVGIGQELIDCSPFELSGGQKRRVAIAGILAMKPKIIILDEPTAGLDPTGRREILELLKRLNQDENITIVMISHNMEDVAEYTKRVIVMNDSRIVADDVTRIVFANKDVIADAGLCKPQVLELFDILEDKGMELIGVPLDEDEAFEIIKEQFF